MSARIFGKWHKRTVNCGWKGGTDAGRSFAPLSSTFPHFAHPLRLTRYVETSWQFSRVLNFGGAPHIDDHESVALNGRLELFELDVCLDFCEFDGVLSLVYE